MADQLSDDVLEAVVELQRVELDRLLAENRRLHEETDRLLRFAEREQVLRQQTQNQIDVLQARLALPSPDPHRLESRIRETESNFDLLKQALWQLVLYLEGKQA